MKTRYKFIKLVKSETWKDLWECRLVEDGSYVGVVAFYPPRGKFVLYNVVSDVIFSAESSRDIADFLDQLNAAKKGAE